MSSGITSALISDQRGVEGEFQISEADPWRQTLILVDTGTFEVTLSTYVLIVTHIKGVKIASLDKDAYIRIGYI